MVRFGSRSDPDRESSKPENWRQWSRRDDQARFDDDLASVDSDVEGFGNTGAQGFSDLWQAKSDIDEGPLPEGAPEDARSQRLRNMNRRFSAGHVVLAAVVVGAAIGAFFAVDRFTGENEPTADGVDEQVEAELIAPGQPRVYAQGTEELALGDGWRLDETFIAENTDQVPVPVDDSDVDLPARVMAGPLLWGGRAHIAIVGAGVGDPDICAVASLSSAELSVVDVAADGACGGRFDATGDRVACRGEDLVLLEVWPLQPEVTVEQPDASRVRVRLERSESGGNVQSLRTTVDLDARLTIGLSELSGAPGSVATVSLNGNAGTCELLDRSNVTVQLL